MRGHLVALISLALLLSAGCAHDRRAMVAQKTLLNAQGAFDEAVYGAAIRARFPAGSSLEALRRYVSETKGKCNERSSDHFRCEIPYRGGFCWAQLIGIDVDV